MNVFEVAALAPTLRQICLWASAPEVRFMIRKLQSGEYRLYSRKKDAKTGRRKNLGTFRTRHAAELHEKAVQYFKRH